MQLAYKHLDSKLRIAELTLGQWLGVLLGVGVAFGWGLYVSPLGTYLTLISAIYLGSLPVGAAILASLSEFDLVLLVRSAVAWRRRDGSLRAGAGSSARGYVVRLDDPEGGTRPNVEAPELDLATLWEDS